MTYLRPDSKSQVTIEYENNGTPKRIEAIVVSTQHDEFGSSDQDMLAQIKADVANILIPRVKSSMSERVQALFTGDHKLHVNGQERSEVPTETLTTGRKIIVDTTVEGARGGGAFSGKDPRRYRSAAYAPAMLRRIWSLLVCATRCWPGGVCHGIAEPVGLYVNTYGTSKVGATDGEIAERIARIFPMRPYHIEQRFKLRTPIIQRLAYGHMGRPSETVTKRFEAHAGGW